MKVSHLTKRQRSKISERELAKTIGGRVQIASGALPVAALKGDVKTKFFLLDDKTTVAKSYSLKLEDFRKIRKQAFDARRRPGMRVHFENDGQPVSLYVVEERDFLKLMELYEEEAKKGAA
jgi:hypothetical protein